MNSYTSSFVLSCTTVLYEHSIHESIMTKNSNMKQTHINIQSIHFCSLYITFFCALHRLILSVVPSLIIPLALFPPLCFLWMLKCHHLLQYIHSIIYAYASSVDLSLVVVVDGGWCSNLSMMAFLFAFDCDGWHQSPHNMLTRRRCVSG